MRRMLLKIFTIFFYLILILSLSGFHFTLLFDFKSFILILGGTLFLSLASFKKGMDKEEIKHIFSWNAIVVSYLTTFVFLFASLSKVKEVERLLSNIALNCRPLLYGFIIFVVLRTDEKVKNDRVRIKESKTTNDKLNMNQNEENMKRVTALSPEEIYYKFREMGLTQREAEIARLAKSGLSNKEIADEMYIAESTVKKHMSHIFEKFNISSREELKHILK